MASGAGLNQSQPSMAEILGNEIGGGVLHILPFFFDVDMVDPPHDQPGEPCEWLIFINVLNPMVVLESDGGPDGASFEDLLQKGWRHLASKAAIDALPSAEVISSDEQYTVCLEGWCGGEMAKEMSCKHRFHGSCIDKWLNVSGSCPVYRYQLPEEEKNRDEREREWAKDLDEL